MAFTTSLVILASCQHLAASEVQSWSMDELDRINKTFTGDYDEMRERRVIRVLMPYSKTFFFFDGAKPRGASYELVKQFETFINKKAKSKTLKINVIIIPTERKELISRVREGKGDIAVGNLTITTNRLEEVDFADPVASGISEILVSTKDTDELTTVFDLAGKDIFVRKSSSYHESLQKLNEALSGAGKETANIIEADDHLEDEDVLEMINAGLITYTVIDSHKGEFWANIFDNIKLHKDITLRREGNISWALRKNSPQLKALINEFVKDHKIGTLLGNILFKRYLKNTSYITDSIYKQDFQRFKNTSRFFEKYGEQYRFDYLMLAALGYQESRLNQNLKSPRGAIGVMQILPSTAKDKNVAIPDIAEADSNIHAGTKYLRFMSDRYFSDTEEMDILNRTLFTFASYNAGPAKIASLRKEAETSGLDPNKWFNNVEVIAARRIGRETVQYVSNIFKYYIAYTLIADKMISDKPAHLTGSSKKKLE